MNIADFLPMFPWEGPPLPRFLGILWPWTQEGSETALSLPTLDIMKPSKELTTSYENIERIDFPDGFDPDTFMPKSIVVHRKAKTR